MIDLLEAQGALIAAGHAATAEAVMFAWAAFTASGEHERAQRLVDDFVALREKLDLEIRPGKES
jgi:hypothetical protein